jgi:NTE family protein
MYYNLVLSGGSLKGLSFIGCIKFMEENNLVRSIRTVVGSSAGAIIALLFCCGMSSKEMVAFVKDEVKVYINHDVDFEYMLDFFNKLSLDNGEYLIGLFKRILQKCTKCVDLNDVSFIDFAKTTGKNLVICGSNLTKNKSDFFSVDNTPDMSIIKALRISVSLPIIFPPVLHNDDIYVDASLFNNFPLDYFTNHVYKDTLGICIQNTNNKTPFGQLNMLSYFALLIDSTYHKINEKCDDLLKNNRIVYVVFDDMEPYNFDINTLKFKVSETMLLAYIERGYHQIKDSFELSTQQTASTP